MPPVHRGIARPPKGGRRRDAGSVLDLSGRNMLAGRARVAGAEGHMVSRRGAMQAMFTGDGGDEEDHGDQASGSARPTTAKIPAAKERMPKAV